MIIRHFLMMCITLGVEFEGDALIWGHLEFGVTGGQLLSLSTLKQTFQFEIKK